MVIEVDRKMTQTMRTAVKSATLVSSAKSEREFLDYFKQDNIGVECNPKCGGCRCGHLDTLDIKIHLQMAEIIF